MITLAQAIEEMIKQNPFLETGLSSGIINLSGLARQLKPQLERMTYKRASEGAIVMALKRMSPRARQHPQALRELKKLKNLTLRSNLTEYAFHNFPGILSLQKQLVQKLDVKKDLFASFSQGISETTLIVSASLEQKVDSIIPKNLLIDKITNLSSITLTLPNDHIYVPGVYYTLLKAIAWENINLIEALSGYSEITIVVKDKDSDRTFACIKNLTAK